MRADLYPEDGLVLTEVTRALPYEPEQIYAPLSMELLLNELISG